MAKKPWKPLIVDSLTIAPTGSVRAQVEELAGQPGLDGIMLGELAFMDDHKLEITNALKRARLKLFLRPKELYKHSVTSKMTKYEKIGVHTLLISCDEDDSVVDELFRLNASRFRMVLTTNKASSPFSDELSSERMVKAYRAKLKLFPFEGENFRLDEAVRPESGAPAFLAIGRVNRPEDAESALRRGATHLLVTASLFGSTRNYINRLWEELKHRRNA